MNQDGESAGSEHVDVSLIAPAFTYVPFFAAKAQGFFDRNGISCGYDFVGSGDLVTEALKAGKIQFAPNTPEGTLKDRAEGGSLIVIAGLTNRLPFKLIGLKRHRTLESLRGGTIGVSSLNEGTVHVIQALLAQADLHHPDDYDLQVVGAHPKRWELLQEDAIDAGLQLTPYDKIAIDAGFSDLGDPSDLFPEFAFGVVAADSEWARDNSDLTVAILLSLLEATEWVYDNFDGACEVLVAESGTDRHLIEASLHSLLDREVIPRELAPSTAGLEVVLQMMQRGGELPAGAPTDAGRYVDPSYLEQAKGRKARQ